MTTRIITGDALIELAKLPAESVHCCVTSPPYYGLRDYGTATWDGGDPACTHAPEARGGRFSSPVSAKQASNAGSGTASRAECPCGARRIDAQLGIEATPDAYVAAMVAVFREVKRVLRNDGVCFINIGDSYHNYRVHKDGGQPPQGFHVDRHGQPESGGRNRGTRLDSIKEKDLIGIPWALAKALRDPYYTGRIKREVDRVWLAAIIDGDGCFFIHKRKAGTSAYSKFMRVDGTEANYSRTADTYGVGLEISNTSKRLIDRVAEIVPGGTFTTQGPDENARRKQMIYRWRLAPNETKRLAQELYPHLVAKQHQARLIFSCPSNGDAGAAAHQAMMDLHNGSPTSINFPAPPSLFEPGWYLRQDIIWGKPNPMPESVTDRCTKSHEYLFLLSKSATYHFDAAAIAENATADRPDMAIKGIRTGLAYLQQGPIANNSEKGRAAGNKRHKFVTEYEASDTEEHRTKSGILKIADTAYPTRNKRSVWTIATAPFPEAHFATFPPALVEPCILAGTSERGVCSACGAPWVRQTEREGEWRAQHNRSAKHNGDVYRTNPGGGIAGANVHRPIVDRGWFPSCRCPAADPVPATVIDPFLGAGTTALVADRLGRNAIGIELNPTYAEMARQRIADDAGLFFETAQ